MLINYMSDIHLEFSELFPDQVSSKRFPEGDVLALAGDIFVIKSFEKLKYFGEVMKALKRKYNHVIAVSGNHEPYGRHINDVKQLKEIYGEYGVVFLDDESIELDGVKFFGGTLWPDMNNDDFAAKTAVHNYLNDYHVIGGMTVGGAVLRHRETMSRLREARPDVVVTHMAPAYGSIHEKYRTASNRLSNYGYYSDVDIPEYVKLWIHGHVHHQVDYTTGIGNTRVVANPRGYPWETRSNGFQFDRTLKLPLGKPPESQVETH